MPRIITFDSIAKKPHPEIKDSYVYFHVFHHFTVCEKYESFKLSLYWIWKQIIWNELMFIKLTVYIFFFYPLFE